MRVFNEWSRQQWLERHVPEEFRLLAVTLTAQELELLDAAIEKYRARILAQHRDAPAAEEKAEFCEHGERRGAFCMGCASRRMG